MKNKDNESLLHMDDTEKPRLVYRYSPVRSVVVMMIFLTICVVTGLVILPRVKEVAIVLAIFSAILLFKMLKTCSVRILLDWPNLIYMYRSLFRNIDETIPSWEVSGISPEITSMWRGIISERLVLEAGNRKLVITPFYSSSDLRISRLMEIVHSLPATRKQALYEIELQRRVQEGETNFSDCSPELVR